MAVTMPLGIKLFGTQGVITHTTTPARQYTSPQIQAVGHVAI